MTRKRFSVVGDRDINYACDKINEALREYHAAHIDVRILHKAYSLYIFSKDRQGMCLLWEWYTVPAKVLDPGNWINVISR